jgi:hypothetical protein
MSFDPMARAVDWLDAYRAGDLETILRMYAKDAVIACGCKGETVTGNEEMREYWTARLREYPASELDDLQPSDGGTLISYGVENRVVTAALTFNATGQITHQRCGSFS